MIGFAFASDWLNIDVTHMLVVEKINKADSGGMGA